MGAIDGINMWTSISENTDSPRSEFLYNVDDVWDYGAVRRGDWKYLYGTVNKKDFWYGSSGNASHYSYDLDDVLKSKVATALAGLITYQQIYDVKNNSSVMVEIVNENTIKEIRHRARLMCRKEVEDPSSKCIPARSPCLFNLNDDPCETTNVIDKHPMIVSELEDAILRYKRGALPIRNQPRDPNADPAKYNGTWINWMDYEHVQRHKIVYNQLSPLATGLISTTCVVFFFLILILLGLSYKRSSKPYKFKDLFDSIEEAKEQTRNQMSLKDSELTCMTYREIEKTRE